MSKEIKIYEEKWHETSLLGTLAGVFTFSDDVARSVDSATGGGERTNYVVEVNGTKHTYSSESERDEKAKKSI